MTSDVVDAEDSGVGYVGEAIDCAFDLGGEYFLTVETDALKSVRLLDSQL